MDYVGKLISNFKDFYNEINAATLTGAIDVVVVRQEDGSFLSSPFHVRFGKMGVLRSREKVVDIEVNGDPVDIHMKLGETGEAFFVQPLDEDEDDPPSEFGTSPIPSSALLLGDDRRHDERSDEEVRSQDSGFEAEDPTTSGGGGGSGGEGGDKPPPQLLKVGFRVNEQIIDKINSKAGLSVDFVEDKTDVTFITSVTTSCTSTSTNVTSTTFGGIEATRKTNDSDGGKRDSSCDNVPVTDDLSRISDLGVVTRITRQDSSKLIMKDMQTQTEEQEEEKEKEIVEKRQEERSQEEKRLEKRIQDEKRSQDEKGKDSSSADEVQQHKEKRSPEKNKGSFKGASEEGKRDREDQVVKGSRNQRRKRRRRCNHKQQQQQQDQQPGGVAGKHNGSGGSGGSAGGGGKKGSSGSQSSDASSTSEVADITSLSRNNISHKDDGVFAMDDVEAKDKLPRSSRNKPEIIPQSSSMPLIHSSATTASALTTSVSAGFVAKGTGGGGWVDTDVATVAESGGRSICVVGPNFHPFSDTDLSPPTSPGNSRPSTPIKSDTEFEVERHRNELKDSAQKKQAEENWNWTWGELPTPPTKTNKKTTAGDDKKSDDAKDGEVVEAMEEKQEGEGSRESAVIDASGVKTSKDADVSATNVTAAAGGTKVARAVNQDDEAVRSMFSGVLSFMRATKKARHNPQAEGIYLEDLNPLDLDPEVAALYFPRHIVKKDVSAASGGDEVSTAAATAAGSITDEDAEFLNGTSIPDSLHCADTSLSDPQPSITAAVSDGELVAAEAEPKHVVVDAATTMFDYNGCPDPVFSLCGRLQELIDNELPESLFAQNIVTYDDFCDDPSSILSSPNLVIRLRGHYYNWRTGLPHLMALMLFQRPLPESLSRQLVAEHMPSKEAEEESRKRSQSRGYSWFWRRTTTETAPLPPPPEPTATKNQDADGLKEEVPSDIVEVTAAETQTNGSNSPTKEDNKHTEPLLRYRKSLRLTGDQIAQLSLHDGSNEVAFSVTTAYQGTTRCMCRIFLWNYDEKIIVSDIDGTITKSDVLGHLMPIIGRDWSQGGVAQLFTKIKNNGYHFLYLSARAIGHARITRDYLRSVVQEDVSLPDGPVMLNPTSLVQAFHREVIERNPEEFKISCLRDIQALFPGSSNPFYAGYGNRINDVWAYRAVGIPISRVFTINHRGELKHELTQTFQSTYSNLSDIVHHMFPLYSQEMLHHGEYSSVRYWRMPLPDYEEEINRLLCLHSGTAAPTVPPPTTSA